MIANSSSQSSHDTGPKKMGRWRSRRVALSALAATLGLCALGIAFLFLVPGSKLECDVSVGDAQILCFSPSGEYLAILEKIDDDKKVLRLIRCRDGIEILSIDEPECAPGECAFSPNERFFGTFLDDESIGIWDLASGDRIWNYDCMAQDLGRTRRISFGSDNHTVLFPVSSDGWNTRLLMQDFTGAGTSTEMLCTNAVVSPSQRQLYAWKVKDQVLEIHIVNMNTPGASTSNRTYELNGVDVAFSEEEQSFYVVRYLGAFRLFSSCHAFDGNRNCRKGCRKVARQVGIWHKPHCGGYVHSRMECNKSGAEFDTDYSSCSMPSSAFASYIWPLIQPPRIRHTWKLGSNV